MEKTNTTNEVEQLEIAPEAKNGDLSNEKPKMASDTDKPVNDEPAAPQSPKTAMISTETADELAMAQYEAASRAMLPTEKMLGVMAKFAQHCVDTGQLPSTINSTAKVIMVFQAGRELGIPPIKSIQSMYFVNNKLTMYGATVMERIRHWARIEYGECDTETATVTIIRKDDGTKLSSTVTMADLKERGIVGNKDTYKKHPRTMLIYKAVGEIVRHIVPEAIGALAIEGDFPEVESNQEEKNRPGKINEAKPNDTGEYELPSIDEIARRYDRETLRERCNQLGIEYGANDTKKKLAGMIRAKLIEQEGTDVITTE